MTTEDEQRNTLKLTAYQQLYGTNSESNTEQDLLYWKTAAVILANMLVASCEDLTRSKSASIATRITTKRRVKIAVHQLQRTVDPEEIKGLYVPYEERLNFVIQRLKKFIRYEA